MTVADPFWNEIKEKQHEHISEGRLKEAQIGRKDVPNDPRGPLISID
jgi:hypothetical protein